MAGISHPFVRICIEMSFSSSFFSIFLQTATNMMDSMVIALPPHSSTVPGLIISSSYNLRVFSSRSCVRFLQVFHISVSGIELFNNKSFKGVLIERKSRVGHKLR